MNSFTDAVMDSIVGYLGGRSAGGLAAAAGVFLPPIAQLRSATGAVKVQIVDLGAGDLEIHCCQRLVERIFVLEEGETHDSDGRDCYDTCEVCLQEVHIEVCEAHCLTVTHRTCVARWP